MSDQATAIAADSHPSRTGPGRHRRRDRNPDRWAKSLSSGGLDDPGCRRALNVDTPTLCFLESLTPVNVCRVLRRRAGRIAHAGLRLLSRKVEAGMVVRTDSERVRLGLYRRLNSWRLGDVSTTTF